MYTKAETSAIRKKFWVSFGQYMKPIPSASGLRVNWPNYKTGVKNIYFRMEAERGHASIGIEIRHPDVELQELYFDHFTQLRKILETCTEESWDWILHQQQPSAQLISKIEKRIYGVNVMDEETWPEMISFLKSRIIALDEFWSNVRPSFEGL